MVRAPARIELSNGPSGFGKYYLHLVVMVALLALSMVDDARRYLLHSEWADGIRNLVLSKTGLSLTSGVGAGAGE